MQQETAVIDYGLSNQVNQYQLGTYFMQREEEEAYESATRLRDGYAIPIKDLRAMLASFSYGHPFRVMTLFKLISGVRNTELEKMDIALKSGNWMCVKLGKNQKSSRQFYVPDYVWKEYIYYRNEYGVPNKKFWHVSASTYKRWCGKVRPNLPNNWQVKCKVAVKNGKTNNLKLEDEYELQFKGIRTTYVTLYFWRMMRRYNNDTHLALMMTQKHMKHATEWMSATHYVENGDRINAKYWSQFDIWDLFKVDSPLTLFD